MKLVLPFLFLTLVFQVQSQKNIEQKDPTYYITKAEELSLQKKYEESNEFYSKISMNDTNYTDVQIATARNYIQMEDFKNAQTTLIELIALDLAYNYKSDMYKILGFAYYQDKNYKKAVETYTEGIAKFPKNFALYYNRSLAYAELEKHKEAIEDLKMAITCKASHASSHYQLGQYALHQGQYTQAMLSFITFLMLESETDRANVAISILENVSNGEFEEKRKNFEWNELENYADMNELVKNKVALEKTYKVKLTVECAYGKQLHFILSTLKYEKDNKGFWNQTYLPFLLDLFNNNKFDGMILASLSSSSNSNIQSKLSSKKVKITEFYTFARQKWAETASKKYAEYEGVYQSVYIEYNDYGLTAIGKMSPANKPYGKWNYYYPNGSLQMISEFNDQGSKEGKWVTHFEHNGKVASQITFKDDKLNGETLIYYDQGELKERKFFKDGVLDDTLFIYYRSGDLLEKYAIKNGEREGDIFGYHENGVMDYTYKYVNGVPNGPYKSYHPNGKIRSEFTLKDDKIDGGYTTYHPNGKVEHKTKYIAGELDGSYEKFYSTGQKREISNYKLGKQIGEYKEFYLNGALAVSGELDESGKQNGTLVNYDRDGKKYSELVYKKGDIIEIHCFDKTGKEIYKSAKKGKKIDYKMYYPDGVLKSEGMYENNEREGKWKYYDRFSTIEAIENYSKGLLTDTAYYYHPNGVLQTIEHYKDNELDGIHLEYDIFGSLIVEGKYKEDVKEFDWYEYNSNGTLINEHYYVNGEQHGIQKFYNVNGKIDAYKEFEYGRIISQNYLDTTGKIMDEFSTEFHGNVEIHDPSNKFIKYKATYKNGLNNGVCSWIDPQNKAYVVGSYINDSREGTWKYYHNNGKIENEINYIHGNREGEVKTYNEAGILVETETYIEDNLEGPRFVFNDKGIKTEEFNYVEGKMHGKAIYYDDEGKIYMFRYYDNGVFKSYSYLDKDGKEIEPIELKPGTNQIVTYFQNGTKASEHTRKNGLIEGHFIVYSSSGKIVEDEEFKNGEFHGKSNYFYPSGAKKSEVTYKYGAAVGKYTEFHENGKVKLAATYLDGDNNGTQNEYSSEGKLIKTSIYYCDELISVKTIK